MNRLLAALAVSASGALALLAHPARAQTTYAASFEGPPAGPFVLGNLHGQDGWTAATNRPFPFGTRVVASHAALGSQSVEIALGNGFQSGAMLRAFNITPTPDLPVLRARFDFLQPLNEPPSTINLALMNRFAISTFAFFPDGRLSLGATPINVSLPRGVWHRVVVDADFFSRLASISIDGVPAASRVPLESAETTLTRVFISAARIETDLARTYFDEFEIGLHPAPPPPPPPACNPDFNADDIFDPDDLADFIACFFAPDCPQADFNQDGITDPDDLADFIAAFFTPC